LGPASRTLAIKTEGGGHCHKVYDDRDGKTVDAETGEKKFRLILGFEGCPWEEPGTTWIDSFVSSQYKRNTSFQAGLDQQRVVSVGSATGAGRSRHPCKGKRYFRKRNKLDGPKKTPMTPGAARL